MWSAYLETIIDFSPFFYYYWPSLFRRNNRPALKLLDTRWNCSKTITIATTAKHHHHHSWGSSDNGIKGYWGRGICLVVCQDAVSGKRFACPVALLCLVVIGRGTAGNRLYTTCTFDLLTVK